MNRSSIFYWLRWILVLPLSIGVGLLIATAIGMILWFMIAEPTLEKYKFVSSPLIASFISVILAPLIAPEKKSVTMLFICGLWLIVISVLLVIVIAHVKIYGEELEVKDKGIAMIQVLCGLIGGWVVSRKLQSIYLLNTLTIAERDAYLVNKIGGIKDINAMTVNERLYISGLMNEFDNTKMINKPRAMEILKLLKVDDESIHSILN